MQVVGIIIFVVATVIIGGLLAANLIIRSKSRRMASSVARQVFPVWAAQGPFRSEAESAAAMRNAYLALLGSKETEKMTDAIAQHEVAYDKAPEKWEETRRSAAEMVSADAATIAEGITAAEHLNKEIVEGGGHRLEFTRQTDGSTGLVYRQLWSDEEIEQKKREDAEAITAGVGNSLVNDPSEEAQALVGFLRDVYRDETGEEADADAVGRTWLAFLTAREEAPEPELVQRFQTLNEAHQATFPEEGRR